MQKTIDQIREGNFDYGSGSLDFSCAKIEFAIRRGQQYEGSFHIYAPSGRFTAGRVFSSDWRMECLAGEFSGAEYEVPFRFHGENLEEGDVVKGTFDIISNHGEYYLPFVASVEYAMPESSVGTCSIPQSSPRSFPAAMPAIGRITGPSPLTGDRSRTWRNS